MKARLLARVIIVIDAGVSASDPSARGRFSRAAIAELPAAALVEKLGRSTRERLA
jgi:hypothetical protein